MLFVRPILLLKVVLHTTKHLKRTVMKLNQLIELDKGFQTFLDKDHFTLIAPESARNFDEFVREAKSQSENANPEPILADKMRTMDLIKQKFQGLPLTIYWVTRHFGGGLQYKSLQEYLS